MPTIPHTSIPDVIAVNAAIYCHGCEVWLQGCQYWSLRETAGRHINGGGICGQNRFALDSNLQAYADSLNA